MQENAKNTYNKSLFQVKERILKLRYEVYLRELNNKISVAGFFIKPYRFPE